MPQKINLNPPNNGKYVFSLRLDHNHNITLFKQFHEITGISMNHTINKLINDWVENNMFDYIENEKQDAIHQLSSTFENKKQNAIHQLSSTFDEVSAKIAQLLTPNEE